MRGLAIENAAQVLEDGSYESGILFRFDEVRHWGAFRETREYAIYHFPDSNEWHGDVIDSSGWRDLTEDEIFVLKDRYLFETAGSSLMPADLR